jgi:hypothetical protein
VRNASTPSPLAGVGGGVEFALLFALECDRDGECIATFRDGAAAASVLAIASADVDVATLVLASELDGVRPIAGVTGTD